MVLSVSDTEKQKSPIGKRLRAARTRMGISQKELGIRAGIDRFSASPRVNQYERGVHNPDFLTLKNFAKVLNVPTSYFFSEDDDLAEMIWLYGALSKKEQKSVLKMLQDIKKQ